MCILTKTEELPKTDEPFDNIIKFLVEWLQSEEGKQSIIDAQISTEEKIKTLNELRKFDYKILQEPMTI